MNSETQQEHFTESQEKVLDRAKAQQKIVEIGNIAEDFYSHPYFEILKQKLDKEVKSLVKSLESVTTLKELYKKQTELKLISLFLDNPKGFLEKRNEILRRMKWSKNK